MLHQKKSSGDKKKTNGIPENPIRPIPVPAPCHLILIPVRPVGKVLAERRLAALHLSKTLGEEIHPQLAPDGLALVREDQIEGVAQMCYRQICLYLFILPAHHVVLYQIVHALHHPVEVTPGHYARAPVGQHAVHEGEATAHLCLDLQSVLPFQQGPHGVGILLRGAERGGYALPAPDVLPDVAAEAVAYALHHGLLYCRQAGVAVYLHRERSGVPHQAVVARGRHVAHHHIHHTRRGARQLVVPEGAPHAVRLVAQVAVEVVPQALRHVAHLVGIRLEHPVEYGHAVCPYLLGREAQRAHPGLQRLVCRPYRLICDIIAVGIPDAPLILRCQQHSHYSLLSPP